jgi:hypothetical protein
VTGQAPRSFIGSVVERSDSVIDALLCRWAYVRLAIDDAGHGLDRYASQAGHIEYGGSGHSGLQVSRFYD